MTVRKPLEHAKHIPNILIEDELIIRYIDKNTVQNTFPNVVYKSISPKL